MIISCPPAVGIGLALGRGARPPPSCEKWGLQPVRQGQSLRSGPADSLRSPLTAGPAALDLADYRVRPSCGQPRDWAERLSTVSTAVLVLVWSYGARQR